MIFIFWIAFTPLQQKKSENFIKNVCENKDFCNVVISSEDINILEFSQKNLI